MTFTNNRLDFFDGESYGEIQHANGLAKGLPNFVAQGLELTGMTLNNGIFVNTGTFGQLGSANETHTITSNYTGFIVIESTLSGRTSTSRIIESPTFLSTDPRTASNIRYFTIYELSNGTIVNDFRHIDYVKTFEVKNIGGSQFVFILNGFVSAPFDASVLAGNRTMINEIDINYNDSVHNDTLIQDILLDLFDKSRSLIGGDKPFSLIFGTRNTPEYHPNFAGKLFDFIENNYGTDIADNKIVTFKLDVSTAAGFSSDTYLNTNKCSIWGSDFYFEWQFEYDNWSNVIVRDAKGNSFFIEESVEIGNGNGTNSANITLSESVMNFEYISVRVNIDSVGGMFVHQKMPVTSLTRTMRDIMTIDNQADSIQFVNSQFLYDITGTTLETGQNDAYTSLLQIGTTGQNIIIVGNWIDLIWGHNRIYPIGTTHTNRMIGGKIYRVTTFPSGEEKVTLLPNQEFEL